MFAKPLTFEAKSVTLLHLGRSNDSVTKLRASMLGPNQDKPHAIIWHRHDLRLDDNPAIASAVKTGFPICAVYVLDPKVLDTTKYGFRRMGARRLQFLLDSLADLRHRYQQLGHDLYIATKDVQTTIGELLSSISVHSLLYCMAKTTYENAKSILCAPFCQKDRNGYESGTHCCISSEMCSAKTSLFVPSRARKAVEKTFDYAPQSRLPTS